MFDGGALLGWQCMVAPTSKTAQAANSSGLGATSVGFIHKLPGRTDASYKMAPALSDTIRELLERKQFPAESISLHLARLTQLSRYDHPFKVFWVFCTKNHMNPQVMSLDQLAAILLRMEAIESNLTKMAYSAILLLPGYDQLRFHSLLKQCKAKWNKSAIKYTSFWRAEDILEKLRLEPLGWNNVLEVRTRLILVLRLLHLARSIDLQRMVRTISFLDGKAFVLLRRKGLVAFQLKRYSL